MDTLALRGGLPPAMSMLALLLRAGMACWEQQA